MFLKIENTDLSKYVKELSITHEIIWDSNAGRTITADYVGDIVGKKWKLVINTIPLSQADSALIMGILESKAFLSVSFIPTNSANGTMTTIQAYVSTPQHTIYSYADGLTRYSAVSFDLVEV